MDTDEPPGPNRSRLRTVFVALTATVLSVGLILPMGSQRHAAAQPEEPTAAPAALPAAGEANAAPRAKRIRGIKGTRAPDISAQTWFNLPTGEKTIDLADYDGKVVYLFFFQSWCPGCHSRGLPTLKAVQERYAKDKDVVFLAVQTVFEGFGTNTADRARATGAEFGLTIPIGHDSGPNDTGSQTMRRYRSGGTPWVVIIDKQRKVQFNGFHVRKDAAIQLIDQLKAR